MHDLLWFVLGRKRLLILNKRSVHVIDTQEQHILFETVGTFIGLSLDETLIVVKNVDNLVAIWNVTSGERIEPTIELHSLFSDHQKVSVEANPAKLVLKDIFTGNILIQLQTPQIEGQSSDTFARIQFRFPGKSLLFQSTDVDTGWGESHYLWCYDIVASKWIFNSFYSINDTPAIFVSPYQDLAIVTNALFVLGYDLNRGSEIFEYRVNERVQAIAFDPTDPLSALVAQQHEIAKMDLQTGNIHRLSNQHGVVALSIDPDGRVYYALSKTINSLKLTVRSLSSNDTLYEIPTI